MASHETPARAKVGSILATGVAGGVLPNQRHGYDRIRVLGHGSFGVASVHRRRLDRALVVFKEIDLHNFRGEQERQLVANEAQIMASLSHENVIQYYNAYITESKLIIEMEYASIGTLAKYLGLQAQPLSEFAVLLVFNQIAKGLDYLHSKSIMHLDLKMENIFLTIEGRVKIGDFGLAQYLPHAASEQASNPVETPIGPGQQQQQKQQPAGELGEPPVASSSPWCAANSCNRLASPLNPLQMTLAFSSPERCQGEETDFKSDIWSLGCILYELIASKPLFCANSLPQLVLCITRIQYQPIKRRDISQALVSIFEQLIARKPSDRPSAQELCHQTGTLLSKCQQANLGRHHLRRNSSGVEDGTQGQHKKKTKGFRRHLPFGRLLANRKSARQGRRQQQQQQHHRQQQQHQHGHPMFPLRSNQCFDMTSCLALMAEMSQEELNQLNYPHSYIYQVRLNTRNIQLNRVQFPQTKRVRSIAKGKSHYLLLTYDNIVYGWGSKRHGQLGACSAPITTPSGASSSSSKAGGKASSKSAQATPRPPKRLNNESHHHHPQQQQQKQEQQLAATNRPERSKSVSTFKSRPLSQLGNLIREEVLLALKRSRPSSKPFIINELNQKKIIQVAAGNNYSVFLSKNGIVLTCGSATSGCLGNAELTEDCLKPVMVSSLLNNDVVYIASGPKHVVAVCGDGRAFAWGHSSYGRLGVGELSESELSIISQPQPVCLVEGIRFRSAFCGDRCTIFIDSERRCWACGENRLNKLGLDQKRRFKKALIVNQSHVPTLIEPLSKLAIVNCSIGRDHATFLTNEGKVIMFGRDVDRPKVSRPKLASERRPATSKTKATRGFVRQRSMRLWRSISSKSLTLAVSPNRQLSPELTMTTPVRATRIETYNNRRMPFEFVVAVSCSSKFTLALTRDDRVYFCGIRSYFKGGISDSYDGAFAPQLIANSDDDCFVRVGPTNSSLMASIQLMGSDQPIIQAQDPRLVAESLSDLWILDYEPTDTRPSSASGSACSSASSSSFGQMSLCSSCSCCSCDSDKFRTACSLESCCELNGQTEYRLMKHEPILEAQPIISLYVPAIFNNPSNSLHLVDLYCFDEGRFYLVLETTNKISKQRPASSPTCPLSAAALKGLGSKIVLNNSSSKQMVESDNLRPETSTTAKCKPSCSKVNIDNSDGRPDGQARITSARKSPSMLPSPPNANVSLGRATSQQGQQIGGGQPSNTSLIFSARQRKASSKSARSQKSGLTGSSESAADMASSPGGTSLEEPRSWSTLANSLGNRIVTGPSIDCGLLLDGKVVSEFVGDDRKEGTVDNKELSDQTVRPLEEEESVGSSPADGLAVPGGSQLKVTRSKSRKKKSRHKYRVSESLTDIDGEETRSMPSWVRREYAECKEHCDDDSELFVIDGQDTEEQGSLSSMSSSRKSLLKLFC